MEQVTLTPLINIISKYRERYATLGYAENQIYPGILDALNALSTRGIRMGVCTSKRVDFAERILSMYGLLEFFSFVSGGDIGIMKHQQLAGLLEAGNIDRTAVMIGDREVDISSAKVHGLRTVGVLWGFGDRDELEQAGADVILSKTNELSQIKT